MMLLVVTALLIGITSPVFQFDVGQGQPVVPQQLTQKIVKDVIGHVQSVQVYASSDGKVCLAEVKLLSNSPNNLGVRPGGVIELLAPDESICVLFGQAKMGKSQIMFRVEKLTTLDAIPPTLRADFPPNYAYIYKVHQLRIY